MPLLFLLFLPAGTHALWCRESQRLMHVFSKFETMKINCIQCNRGFRCVALYHFCMLLARCISGVPDCFTLQEP